MNTVKSPLLVLALFFVAQIVKSQSDTKAYSFKDFDKVQIENINGVVEIVLGKSYAISVSGEDNAQEQVQITKSTDKLLLKLNSKYTADWKNRKVVKIKIQMPEISKLFNFSNADVTVNNFIGRYIGLENKGNGNVTLAGTVVDFMEIQNDGNGNVNTQNINAKKVDISKTGNGDISIKTNAIFSVEMSGNGDIVNYGKGKAIIKKQSGNGNVVYRN